MKTKWLSNLLKIFGSKPRPAADAKGEILADPEMIKQMVRSIVTTRPDEIGCDECFEQVDRFADAVLDGKDAAEAMPLVQDHLNRCGNCREEFEALLTALRALT
jgi:hypothetical protein